MSLRLYMDVHVPAAITEGLRRRAIDVLTSQEDGTRQADDEQLLKRSTELERVLVSQDEDLHLPASVELGPAAAFAHTLTAPLPNKLGTNRDFCG